MMDFSKLTDEQLFQLIQGAMASAISRGEAIAYAAQAEVLSQQEKAKIRLEEIQRLQGEKARIEVEQIKKKAREEFRNNQSQEAVNETKRLWELKMAAIEAIREWGYNGEFEINVWENGSERRVYFQDKAKSTWKYCLYVTGNVYNAPGKFTEEGSRCFFDEEDRASRLKTFLEVFSRRWKTIRLSSYDRTEGIIPDEKELQQYRDALGLSTPIEIKL